jgi:hypothetical protein
VWGGGTQSAGQIDAPGHATQRAACFGSAAHAADSCGRPAFNASCVLYLGGALCGSSACLACISQCMQCCLLSQKLTCCVSHGAAHCRAGPSTGAPGEQCAASTAAASFMHALPGGPSPPPTLPVLLRCLLTSTGMFMALQVQTLLALGAVRFCAACG